MRARLPVLPSLLLPLAVFFLAAASLPRAQPAKAQPSAGDSPRLPLLFEPNRGQTDPSVRFLARGSGGTIFVSSAETVLVPRVHGKSQGRADTPVRVRFSGADPAANVTGEAPPGSVSHYYLGNDPSRWITDVAHFSRLRCSSIYPGIDLVYYAAPEGAGVLEYDFVVAPGADPAHVRLEFPGSNSLRLDSRGDLVTHSAGGEFRQRRPVAYQEIRGVRETVECAYALETSDDPSAPPGVRITAGTYDRSRPLVIDPVISYSTYLGGSDWDGVTAVSALADGRCVVGGFTGSTDFPAAPTAPGLPSGRDDCFLALFSASGALQTAVYFGSSGSDSLVGVAVGERKAYYGPEIFVVAAGTTWSPDFPRNGGFQGYQGNADGFVALFNARLNLVEGTYLGGSGGDHLKSVSLGDGGLSVVGLTFSSNFPLVAPLAGARGRDDAFLTRFARNPVSGSVTLSRWPVFSTYLGGSHDDWAYGVAESARDTITVVGSTRSPDFPTLNPLQALRGITDGFVTRFVGARLTYSTFLGGSGSDSLTGVTRHPFKPVVVGHTRSSDFPMVRALFPDQSELEGNSTAVLARLDVAAGALEFSTYLEPGRLTVRGIDEDGSGIYVCAMAQYPRDTPQREQIQPTPNDMSNMWLAKLRPDGSDLIYATFLGGADDVISEFGQHSLVSVDSNGNAYVGASTRSFELPLVRSSQSFLRGFQDGFLVRIAHLDPPSNPAITVRTQSDMRIDWRDNSFNETGFEIERRVGAGVFNRIALVSGSTHFRDMGLSANTPYTYRIRAVNDAGASVFSSPLEAFTLPNPPTAPGGLAAVARSSSQIELRWVDESANETGFRIERSTDGISFAGVTSLPANTVSFSNRFLAAGTLFYYRVRAYNTGGNSPSSNPASARTLIVPPAPSEASAIPLSGTTVRVEWQHGGSAAAFQVERRSAGGFGRVGTPQTGTTFFDTGLRAGGRYAYRVRAANAAGESSPYSNEAPVVLPRGALRAPRSLHFDPVQRGRSRTRTVTVSNASSTESVYVKVGEAGAPFTVVSGSGEAILPPGEQRRVTITFRPRRRGGAAGSLALESSDPVRPTHQIRLEGRGQ